MTRKSLRDRNCSVAQFAEVLGDKWSLLILRDAFVGVQTYSEFEQRIGVAKNVLSERLGHLVDHGVLAKMQTKPGVERYHYELTPKGRALFPVIVGMIQWSDKWVFGIEGEPMRILDKKSEAPVQPIEVTARDGRSLQVDDIRYTSGPRGGEIYKPKRSN